MDMLKKSRSWDSITTVLAHEDPTQKNTSSISKNARNMTLQVPETTEIITSCEKKDGDMTNCGNSEDRTSETVSLLSGHEDDVDDDETSTGVKWPPHKKHKKIIFYQWTGLSKKPSFFKKISKASKEEKEPLVITNKKAKIHQNKMESFRRRSSKTAVKEVVSCPVVGNLANIEKGPEWAKEASAKSYFMQQIVELSEQLPMEEISPLKNKSVYLHLLPKADQRQAAQVEIELEKEYKAYLQLCQKNLLEPEQSQASNREYLTYEEEEKVGLQNPSTHLNSSQEFASYAYTVQDMAPYSYEKDPLLATIPSSASIGTSNQIGEIPITGLLDRKCCNSEPFMIEITALKTRQDLLEQEFLLLNSRYHSDNNIVMECLRQQHLRCSQLLVNISDLQEQQHAEIGSMKEMILYMKEMMAYQSCEQDRDIWDKFVLFQSNLSKIEAEQKKRSNAASLNKANSIQLLYNKVINLLPTTMTNTCQKLYDKFMMNCLPVMVTILLICFSAVSIPDHPLTTAPLYVILILVVSFYGDLPNWSTMSVTLRRSWVVTQGKRLLNRLRLNE
ncbi:uncharacterized protein LOC130290345 [Hyla sarda]|uniref:uncharacterized protein LOC130290345 n=1 Tax=Hyla sarda TaxID=327740 RepID=UPI0024C36D8B|nr:uncharacterized protein LOC130290345 [Hyla sarda]XP_056393818.1 uncharacterized protein LOC130290345 [Hyla sarda]